MNTQDIRWKQRFEDLNWAYRQLQEAIVDHICRRYKIGIDQVIDYFAGKNS